MTDGLNLVIGEIFVIDFELEMNNITVMSCIKCLTDKAASAGRIA